MTLTLPSWRVLLAFTVTGSALASGWLGDWGWAATGAACVLVPLAWRACGELAATRTMLRDERGLPGRHRKHGAWAVVVSAARTAAGWPRRVLTVVGLY